MRQRAACAARLERELLNKKSGFSCINPGCRDTRLFCGIIPVKAGWLVGMPTTFTSYIELCNHKTYRGMYNYNTGTVESG